MRGRPRWNGGRSWTPGPPPRRRIAGTLCRVSRGLSLLLPVVLGALLLAGCGSSIPVVSFDPSTPCTTDGRQPGAYPDLEALLPTEYQGAPPDNVDSGRSCTPAALGALADDGITALRFAGATWDLAGATGLTVAVFEADGLTPGAIIDFYQAGASGNSKLDKVVTSDTRVGGRPGRRLDVLQSDGTGQTIVAWPATDPGRVFVLLASDLGDANVVKALESLSAL